MTKFDLKTLALSCAGALALSAACIGAAVAPAHGAEAPLTVAAWQQVVGDKVSSVSDMAAADLQPGRVVRPVLALRFDAAGRFVDAEIRRSSGSAAIDREVLHIARNTRYPALPAAYRGVPQTVELRLTVGNAQDLGRSRALHGEVTTATRADSFRVAGR